MRDVGSLQWSEALALGLAEMDHTHQEFVELLSAVEDSDDTSLELAWRSLIAHTEAHFGQEDAWMSSTGFSSENCHSTQHKVVLDVMREGLTQPAEKRADVLRFMACELAGWFPFHAQTMDAALAFHMRSVGFDPDGTRPAMRKTEALPLIHGCGSKNCAP